jgi:hypothetical protein
MTEITIAFEARSGVARRRAAAAIVKPTTRYPARVARQLALAHALQKRVISGEFRDYATMARALGLTRARVTQLMDLLLLAPDIQQEILDLCFPPGKQPICERHLRQLTRTSIWTEQRARWAEIGRAASIPAVVGPDRHLG